MICCQLLWFLFCCEVPVPDWTGGTWTRLIELLSVLIEHKVICLTGHVRTTCSVPSHSHAPVCNQSIHRTKTVCPAPAAVLLLLDLPSVMTGNQLNTLMGFSTDYRQSRKLQWRRIHHERAQTRRQSCCGAVHLLTDSVRLSVRIAAQTWKWKYRLIPWCLNTASVFHKEVTYTFSEAIVLYRRKNSFKNLDHHKVKLFSVIWVWPSFKTQ